ncbi:methyltransferase domain-containing protein [Bizionia paragorgiae]|jgi:spermidine synthase|uniref:spermidine synthase n=1 Tax=Bizionia paragorgiae TaxID=283786 RepID=UPI00299D5A11|nr:methyltransferase domain-containing protein [Bizionia paragorgiae]MDX1270877.1 methyltransferase domain-containing protein [Bizionia paragorgiae]
MIIKRLLSFIWPQTTTVNSDYSGVLELTVVNGKKMLDSKNANYSFGSLQRILERGLREIELKDVSSVVLLGLGGGSLITSLRERFNYSGKIYAVDIDSVVIDIAKKEFNIQESEHLHIFNADAYDYVKAFSTTTDLIIVDLFIDTKVPTKFYSEDFCSELSRILSPKGQMIFNLGMDDSGAKERQQVITYFKSNPNFKCTILEKIEGTNVVIIVETIPQQAK